MSTRLKTTLATAVAIAIFALGCGSDESSTSSTSANSDSSSANGDSSSPSKAEFVEQANAACQKEKKGALAKVALYTRVHRSDGLSQEALAKRAFNSAILSTVEGEIDALQEMTPPAGEEEAFQEMLAAKEAALRKAQKVELTAELPEINDLVTAPNKQIRSFGLDQCISST